MISFSLNLSFPTPPRCPVCQRDLTPRGFWVCRGFAFCLDCSKECSHDALELEILCALAFGNSIPYVCLHGVVFYAPAKDGSRSKSSAELLADIAPRPSLFPAEFLQYARQRDERKATSPVTTAQPPPATRRPPRLLNRTDPSQQNFAFNTAGKTVEGTRRVPVGDPKVVDEP